MLDEIDFKIGSKILIMIHCCHERFVVFKYDILIKPGYVPHKRSDLGYLRLVVEARRFSC